MVLWFINTARTKSGHPLQIITFPWLFWTVVAITWRTDTESMSLKTGRRFSLPLISCFFLVAATEHGCSIFMKGKLLQFVSFQSRSSININVQKSDAHSEPSEASKMEVFAKIVSNWKPLTVFIKSSMLDVWLGSEYASKTKIFTDIV